MLPHGAGARIHRRPLKHQSVHTLDVVQGELCQDLAAERVGDEMRRRKPHGIHPAGQSLGKLREAQDRVGFDAVAVARQVNRIDRAQRGELDRRGYHVAARDDHPVHEHDRAPGTPVAPHSRVHRAGRGIRPDTPELHRVPPIRQHSGRVDHLV